MSSPGTKGLDETGIVREVGDDTQLDLVVVGDEKLRSRARDESLAKAAPDEAAHRDVVQVRLVRREPPRAGDGLVERGVDPPVRGDLGEQALAVGGAQLLHLPVPQERVHEGMGVAQAQQALGVGGVTGLGALLRHEAELVEQDVPQLRGRVDVELLARELVDLGLEPASLRVQLVADGTQLVDVDRDARDLHLGEHPDQGDAPPPRKGAWPRSPRVPGGSLETSRPSMATCAAAITAPAGTPSGSPAPSSATSLAKVEAKLFCDRRPSAGGLSAAQGRRKTGQARQRGLALPRIEQVGGDRGVEVEPGEADSLGLERPHELFGPVGDNPFGAVPALFGEGRQLARRRLARRLACRQASPRRAARSREARRILPVASRGCRSGTRLPRAPRRRAPLSRTAPGRPPRRARWQSDPFAPAKVASQRRAWATSSRRTICVRAGRRRHGVVAAEPEVPRRRYGGPRGERFQAVELLEDAVAWSADLEQVEQAAHLLAVGPAEEEVVGHASKGHVADERVSSARLRRTCASCSAREARASASARPGARRACPRRRRS